MDTTDEEAEFYSNFWSMQNIILISHVIHNVASMAMTHF